MASVGLVVHHDRDLACRLALESAEWLERAGHRVYVDADDAAALPVLARWVDGAFPADLDVVVSIGGDGTMLRTVQLVSEKGTPVLGVNVGHLGYLTEVEPAGCADAIRRVLAGDFEVEERMTLDVKCRTSTRTALNDAVVEKLESGHTVRVAVTVTGHAAISYAADALIVSTPTGSTAYNLSAGGPLVSPRMDAIVLTPVAAHSLLGRPVVLPGDDVVRVEVVEGAAVLGIDGRGCDRLAAGDVVECCRGAHAARLVTFGERDFWSIVKAKFGLNGGTTGAG